MRDRLNSVYASVSKGLRRSIFVGAAMVVGAVCPPEAAAGGGTTSGFGFLELEASARAASLGGSLSALYSDDVNVLFYNPALLNEEMHGSLSVSYLNFLNDVNAGFAAYSRNIQRVGTVGVGIRFMTWGDIQGADEQGRETDSFGARDLAVTAAFSRASGDRLRYGGGLHLVRSSLASYDALAVGGDAGVAYHLPDQNVTLAASVNNVGTVVNSFGTVDDELPLDIRVAVSKRLTHVPLLLNVTAHNLHRPGEGEEDAGALSRAFQHLIIGGEFQFSEAFHARLGYNHRRHEQLKTQSRLDLAGFGAGFGIRLAAVNVDYAYTSWSAAGGLHQFTVRTRL